MARRALRLGFILAPALALAACATMEVVDPPTALNGRGLDTALNLYGQWDEKLTIDGEPQYLWRRAVVADGKPYVCELRVKVSIRNVIRAVTTEGFPEACGLFSVQYKSTNDSPPDAAGAQAAKAAKADLKARPARRYRPVGP
ncbi:hypothetical protein [Phenylobacterium sp.]|uniref:hypothetical protein n=1 Tax=Phenylobacterium sp. TaxID=1871053 RepID=UPI0037845140